MMWTRASKISKQSALRASVACVRLGVVSAILVACGGAQVAAADVAPAGSSPDASTRRPDGVVIEPTPALPSPVLRAKARDVVSLREPVGRQAIARVVQAVAEAWQSGSLDALVGLLTSDAGPIDARGRGRGSLKESWRQRLHTHEYSRLAGVQLIRDDQIEYWDVDELGESAQPAPRPDLRPHIPPDMRPGEIFVRAPVDRTRIAGERLFGDVLLLVLRREDGELRIAAYGEIEDAPAR
ncbi:MAG TPA: hypothetical protein VGY54_01275 [Polyangiaceae bacterium]|nr:hypothetical protein [Polyangiaceae bacterium]